MKTRNKNTRIALVLALLTCPLLFTTAFAGYGLGETAGAADLITVGGASDVQTLIGNVIGTALSLISVVFFALMLYGGFMWMTARGNTDQTRKAMDTIIAAVIGITVVLGAYALTRFVFTSLGSGNTAGATGTQPIEANVNCCYTYHKEANSSGSGANRNFENEEDCKTFAQGIPNAQYKFLSVPDAECNADAAEKLF